MTKKITGKHVFWAVVAFFSVITAVNAVFMYFAITTMPGLAEKNPYEAGRTYNKEIQKAQVQQQLGWALSAKIDRTAVEDSDKLVVVALDEKKQPLQAYVVKAELARPATNDGLVKLNLIEVAPGQYAAPLKNKMQAGQWQLRVDVIENSERKFRHEERIILP